MNQLFDLKFEGIEELKKLAEHQAALLSENVTAAVVDTTLFGINKIANDCTVDTGRLRASLTGDFGDEADVGLKRGKIGEGKAQSTTKIDMRNMEGTIGTNVEYALHVEYGHASSGPKKLTAKQRRYLFAVGILKTDKKGNVVPNIHARINRRADMKNGVSIADRGRYRVKGKGFFRKNIPIIDAHFNRKMNEAIQATSEGRSLRSFKGD